MTTEYFTHGGTPRPPQLDADDIAKLSPTDVNKARRLGQLVDLLATGTEPRTIDDSMTLDVWNALSPYTRAAMIRAHGPNVDPTGK